MLLRPKTLRKYQEAEETQDASSDMSSMPRCSMGLKRRVSGKGTLVVTKPEKCQLIQPPMTIMGSTLVRLPLSMSVIMDGSVMGLGGAAALASCALRTPESSLLRKCLLMRKDCLGRSLPFSLRTLLRMRTWESRTCARSTFFWEESRTET